jgi:hypothetical protein
MKTEARKTFRHGFNLTEEEFRRIVDTASEKVRRKLQTDAQLFVRFELKYKNGTTTLAESIEDVLSQENIASKQIVRLSAWIADGEVELDNLFSTKPEPANLIRFRFVNLREEDDEPWSAYFYIKGDERDWVLVTASELEERIAKVKCQATPSLFRRSAFGGLLPGLFILLSLISLAYATTRSDQSLKPSIEDRWKAGTLRDPIEAIALFENRFERSHLTFGKTLISVLLVPLLVTLTLSLALPLLSYLHPPYSFAWGDYTRVLEQRARTRQVVYGSVGLALLIGIVAGIIANRFPH